MDEIIKLKTNIIMFEKFKERREYKKSYNSVQERFTIAGWIQKHKQLRIPSGKVPIAVTFYNAMLPFIVEGFLEENLNKIRKS